MDNSVLNGEFTKCPCGAAARWNSGKGMYVCDVCLEEIPKEQSAEKRELKGDDMKEEKRRLCKVWQGKEDCSKVDVLVML